MTVTTKSEDKRIECFYDSNSDKETFALTLPSGKYGFITIRVNRLDIDGLIDTLKRHDEVMRLTTRGRR